MGSENKKNTDLINEMLWVGTEEWMKREFGNISPEDEAGLKAQLKLAAVMMRCKPKESRKRYIETLIEMLREKYDDELGLWFLENRAKPALCKLLGVEEQPEPKNSSDI